MKTVIEMASEAGLGFFKTRESDDTSVDALKRFAAIVLENFNRQMNQACEEARLLDAGEKQQELDSSTSSDSEPVAWLSGGGILTSEKWQAEEWIDYGGTATPLYTVQPSSKPVVNEVAIGTAAQLFDDYVLAKSGLDSSTLIYTTPPTAALAAKQMRDAAAMEAYKWCAESRHVKLGDIVFKAIAALPVPEFQWRDLTDDEVAELFNKQKVYEGWTSEFTASVIAKFKEKQL